MKLKVLGSSGAELEGHNLPAFLLDGCLLLDAGTISTALNETEQRKIEHILITHPHLDHIKGIPFLADNISLRNNGHNVTVLGSSHSNNALKNSLLNNLLWPDFTKIPNARAPVLKLKTIKPGKNLEIGEYRIRACKVNHSVPALGFIVEDKNGKRLLYSGDTGPTEEIWKCAKTINCAIIEVSFPNRLRGFAFKTGHLTPALLLKEIKKIEIPPEKILVTHPKAQYLKDIKKEINALGIREIRILRCGESFTI